MVVAFSTVLQTTENAVRCVMVPEYYVFAATETIPIQGLLMKQPTTFLWVGKVPPEMRGDDATTPSDIAIEVPGPDTIGTVWRKNTDETLWEQRNDSGRLAAILLAHQVAELQQELRTLRKGLVQATRGFQAHDNLALATSHPALQPLIDAAMDRIVTEALKHENPPRRV